MKTTILISILLGSLATVSASADTYHVTWDIDSLSLSNTINPSGLMYLDLQLTDGTNTGAGDASVTISNLTLSAGSWQPALADIGNVSYLPGGSVVLTDGTGVANAVADHAQGFVAGSGAVLSFDFTASASIFNAPPDFFNVALLDADESTIPTLGPTQREFIGYQITGDPTVLPQTYSVDPLFAASESALGDPRFVNLSPPVVAILPEPSAFAAVGLGLLVFAGRRCRK